MWSSFKFLGQMLIFILFLLNLNRLRLKLMLFLLILITTGTSLLKSLSQIILKLKLEYLEIYILAANFQEMLLGIRTLGLQQVVLLK